MSNFAELGIKVDSSPAAQAAAGRAKLVDSAAPAAHALANQCAASHG
ncbi:hypothetical protein I5I78_29980, partial [Pseudomonas aeruginosa]|nr:hypothetical protein [Pseudomonas aeruginosa]